MNVTVVVREFPEGGGAQAARPIPSTTEGKSRSEQGESTNSASARSVTEGEGDWCLAGHLRDLGTLSGYRGWAPSADSQSMCLRSPGGIRSDS